MQYMTGTAYCANQVVRSR